MDATRSIMALPFTYPFKEFVSKDLKEALWPAEKVSFVKTHYRGH